MADFPATIRLILDAQKAIKDADKAAKAIERKFDSLQNKIAKKGPLDSFIDQNDELVKQKRTQDSIVATNKTKVCLLYTSPSPRD